MTTEVIDLRLPPTIEYLPVIRATVGVIAGAMTFNYDDIIQIRVPASEAFGLAVNYVTAEEQVSDASEITVRFAVEPDKIQVSIPPPEYYTYAGRPDSPKENESEAVLKSLMDGLEFGEGAAGKPMICAYKYKSTAEA